MFQFIEFLRVVATGLISFIIFCSIFYKSAFLIHANWVFLISALLGLLIEPFLRGYHPFRNEIKKVIKHVELYIREVLSEPNVTTQHYNPTLENALARAIYEYCIRTFPSAETFSRRVNEQIRFFYFYYFISIIFKINSFLVALVLLIKLMDIKTNMLKFSYAIVRIVRNEFLLGINDIKCLILLSIFYILTSLVIATKFFNVAKGIILNELDTRHVFLLDQKEKIQDLARLVKKDEILFALFQQAVDKEKGTRI